MPAKNSFTLCEPVIPVLCGECIQWGHQPARSLAIDVALWDELTTLLRLLLKWPEEIAELPAGFSSLPERNLAHPLTNKGTYIETFGAVCENVCSHPCPLVNIRYNCTFIFK